MTEIYNVPHPLPLEWYRNIFLPRYDSIFADFEIYKEKAIDYHILELRRAKLLMYWKSIFEFISNTIIFHLQKLSDDFYKSQFFTNVLLISSRKAVFIMRLKDSLNSSMKLPMI